MPAASNRVGWGARARGTNDRARAHQLETLDVQRPGSVVLIHLLSEIEALEVKPLGPVERGSIVKDRHDADVTSYGVERGLQKLIASMRVDLDAPSDIEAMSLMADGYLIAKRAFQRLRQRGQSWTAETLPNVSTWRFTAMVDVLGKPSRKLSRHLKTARHSTFKAPRLAIGQTFGICLLTLAAALTLVALGAMWSALRPAAGGDGLWIIATSGLLALAAWLVGRHVGDDMRAGSEPAWTKAIFALDRQGSNPGLGAAAGLRRTISPPRQPRLLEGGALKEARDQTDQGGQSRKRTPHAEGRRSPNPSAKQPESLDHKATR